MVDCHSYRVANLDKNSSHKSTSSSVALSNCSLSTNVVNSSKTKKHNFQDVGGKKRPVLGSGVQRASQIDDLTPLSKEGSIIVFT